MAAWPELDELKQVLDVTSDDWDGDDYEDTTRLSRLLAAAIDRVKHDVGEWDEYTDEPTDRLAQAALTMAVMMHPHSGVDQDAAAKQYAGLIKGYRKRFAVA